MRNKLITLATSVRNDAQGLFFTINSAWLSVKGTALENELDIVVVNDSDDAASRGYIDSICAKLGVRCQSVNFRSNHAGRNAAVKMSNTPYTVLCDSHVLFRHGFFGVYLGILKDDQSVGLIHSPFTYGGVPTSKSNCFYNMIRFESNLHGSFSRRGAASFGRYDVALAPHAAYGFRTAEWLDYGGYIDQCKGCGGGEPFVSFKYWMFGQRVCVTADTGFIHMYYPQYKKVRGQWRLNHVITAAALGGEQVGKEYAKRLACSQYWSDVWSIAGPLYHNISARAVVPFSGLVDMWKLTRARPFV